jgi:hypothetical protein
VRRVRPTAVRVAHAVAVASALAALALAFRQTLTAFALLAASALAALATPFLEWVAVPSVLAAGLPRLHVLLLLLSSVVAWLSRSMGILVLDPAVVPLVTASLLVPIALVFALAPRTFAPGRTLVPASLFLLVLAGLDPAPRGYGPSTLWFLRDADHNGFADRYLPLAVVVLLALWAASLTGEGLRWRRRHVVGVGVSGALAIGLAAAGIAGLPLLQPRVESAFASALDQGTTGLSAESTLGEFAELATSRRRVLDLRSSVASGGSWLLPSEVFTRFDGRRWSNAAPRRPAGKPKAAATRPLVLRPTMAPSSVGPLLDGVGSWFLTPAPGVRGALEVRVDQAEVGRWPLLLPRGPLAVTAEAPYLEEDRFGLLRRPGGTPLTLYGAVFAAGSARSKPPALSVEERAEYLSLPPQVDARVAELARTLAVGSADPRGRLHTTVRHLQTSYRYTLAPGTFRAGGDPLAEFLFEKKAAYCEYFATAAVVLLRLQGVPARFVKGLSVGLQTDLGGGLHVVRESDAHAWIEAFLPGEGWVEEDPTPPGQFASAHPPASGPDRLLQRARAALSSAWNRLRARGPTSFLVWLGRKAASLARRAAGEPVAWLLAAMLALGIGLGRWWHARRRRPRLAAHDAIPEVPPELRALVRDVERRWAALGRPRPAGRGLLEHARTLGVDTVSGPPAPATLPAAAQEIVRVYYRVRFGGEVPDPAETTRLRALLRG